MAKILVERTSDMKPRRHIFTDKYCDACFKEFEEAERKFACINLHTYQIMVSNKTLKLCDEHAKELYSQLKDLLDADGISNEIVN